MIVDLALSGGGVKGVAHIGVLKEMEEREISIHSISGCSSGSIAATLFASGYTSEEIYFLVKKYISNIKKNSIKLNIFSLKKNIMGINNGSIIENVINKLCNEKGINDISDIKMPIYIPAVDIITGKLIYFTNSKKRIHIQKFDNEIEYIYGGNIGSIVRASCSFPGVFSPKEYNKKIFVDGGLKDIVPVEPLTQYGNKIIAVTFNDCNKKNINNLFDVILQSFDIMADKLKYESIKKANYNIEINLDNIKLLEYKKAEYIYKQGYIQAKTFFNNTYFN